jgi:hypothetical protein
MRKALRMHIRSEQPDDIDLIGAIHLVALVELVMLEAHGLQGPSAPSRLEIVPGAAIGEHHRRSGRTSRQA